MSIFPAKDSKICIIGLGYVGIPLLVEIMKVSNHRSIVGFDIDHNKIDFLKQGNLLTEFGYESTIFDLSGSNDLILQMTLKFLLIQKHFW